MMKWLSDRILCWYQNQHTSTNTARLVVGWTPGRRLKVGKCYVNIPLIYYLVREQTAWVTSDRFWLLSDNEDNNSHDTLLLHDFTKLHLLFTCLCLAVEIIHYAFEAPIRKVKLPLFNHHQPISESYRLESVMHSCTSVALLVNAWLF